MGFLRVFVSIFCRSRGQGKSGHGNDKGANSFQEQGTMVLFCDFSFFVAISRRLRCQGKSGHGNDKGAFFQEQETIGFLRFLLLFPADCAAKAKADREKVRAHFVVGAGNYWVWAIFYSDAISRRLHGQGKADTVTIVAQFRLRTGKYWLFSFSRIISNRLRGQGKRGHSDGTQRPHCDKKQFPKQFPADCLGRASVTSLRFLAPQCYPQAARSEHKLARQRYR